MNKIKANYKKTEQIKEDLPGISLAQSITLTSSLWKRSNNIFKVFSTDFGEELSAFETSFSGSATNK